MESAMRTKDVIIIWRFFEKKYVETIYEISVIMMIKVRTIPICVGGTNNTITMQLITKKRRRISLVDVTRCLMRLSDFIIQGCNFIQYQL